MAMLDWVVWHAADFTRGVGLKLVRSDEFWVEGHFPGRPMFPGVLMIETGAQLASFLYNSRFVKPRLPVFTRIEDASFRAAVVPGDELYLLCQDVKFSQKRFISDIQGIVAGKIAFEARITGMSGDNP
jgi:3-hydroxyacyl-[acyl-carrier-protein] dehydratase